SACPADIEPQASWPGLDPIGANIASAYPDAVQRVALAQRCTADPGPRLLSGLIKKPGSRVCSAPLRFAACCAAPGTRTVSIRGLQKTWMPATPARLRASLMRMTARCLWLPAASPARLRGRV